MILERLIAKDLLRLASQYPVITLTGPRQSGKTTLCKKSFPNYAYVNLEDLSARNYAIDDPHGFLQQFDDDGVILDEIQRTPDLPSYIQTIIDTKNKAGQFILTGSQQLEVTDTINQSLAGRTAILRLLPFAYDEIYHEGKTAELSNILYSGFYPRIHDQNLDPTEALSFYLATYIERDLRRLINIKDLSAFERFLKICATRVGQLLNYSSLANECGINQNTVKEWLSLLKASYIIYEIQPHFENFRKRLTKSSKLYFYDVGLASYLLGITKPEHIDAHPMRGALFENFIVGEFIKNCYNNVKDSNLYFFRDHTGNEVDLVLDLGLQLISIEIKASKTIGGDCFKGLDFYQKLSGDRNSARYLIYAGDENYTRQGVKVFSYQALKEVFTNLR
jgi:uncharacterized protein